MGRLVTIAVAVASCLLIWKSGAIITVLPQQSTSSPSLDAGPVITNSGDAMQTLKSGHESLQVPSQSPAWNDVTGNSKGQIAPGMDPIANLEFARAFRASQDLGDITMDHIQVHHFALAVDPAKYIQQLKADPSSGVTPEDEAVLGNAGIEVEVWISASDSYIHQMKIDVSTTQFIWGVIYHFSDFVKGGGPASA